MWALLRRAPDERLGGDARADWLVHVVGYHMPRAATEAARRHALSRNMRALSVSISAGAKQC
eukprot:gene46920-7201_t